MQVMYVYGLEHTLARIAEETGPEVTRLDLQDATIVVG